MEQLEIIKTEVKTLFKIKTAYETTLGITTNLRDNIKKYKMRGQKKENIKEKWRENGK